MEKYFFKWGVGNATSNVCVCLVCVYIKHYRNRNGNRTPTMAVWKQIHNLEMKLPEKWRSFILIQVFFHFDTSWKFQVWEKDWNVVHVATNMKTEFVLEAPLPATE